MLNQTVSRLYTLGKNQEQIQATHLVRQLLGLMGTQATLPRERVIDALYRTGYISSLSEGDNRLSTLDGKKLRYDFWLSGPSFDHDIHTRYVILSRQGDSNVRVTIGIESRCE